MDASEVLPSKLLDAIASPLFVCAGDSLLYANTAIETLTGHTRETLAGLRVTVLISPVYHGLLRDWQQMPDGARGKIVLVRRDGSELHAEAAMTPFAWGGQERAWVVTILSAQDGSLREELSERWQKYLDALPIRITYADSDLRCRFANEAYARWFGYSPQEIVGKPVREFLGEETFNALLPQLQRALAGEQAEFELPVPYRYVGTRIVHGTLIPDISSAGQVRGYFALLIDKTEEEQAREELRMREVQLVQVASTVRDVFFVFDIPPQKFIYISPACEAVWGRPIGSLMRSVQVFDELFHPADREHYLREFGRSQQHAEPSSFVARIIRYDGSIRWLDFRIYPVQDETGNTYRLVGTSRDITAQREAEERFRAVFDHCPDAILLLDPETRGILDCNPAACVMNGYTRDELIGQNISLINVYPESGDLAEMIQQAGDYLALLRQHPYIKYEAQHRRKDGSVFPVEVLTLLVRIGEREIIMGFDRDVSDRKQAEKALRENEARLRTIIESAPVGIAVAVEKTGLITDANPAFCAMTGYTLDELRHLRVSDISVSDDWEAEEALIGEVLAGKRRHYEIEKRFVRRDGSIFPARLVSALIGDSRDAVGLVEDITERKRLQELRLEQERLKYSLQKEHELNELKTRMMVRLAHEFRTPLSVISMSGHLLEHYYNRLTEEQRRERFAQIEAQVANLSSMLDNISFVIRGQMENALLSPSVFNLTQFCLAVLDEFRAAKGASHTLEFETSGDPECLERVRADVQVVRLILTNLLSNAIKYSEKDTTIRLKIAATETDLTLQVIDQGIGILPEDQRRIFEPFYRGSNFDERPGLGVGLSIVKQAVEGHGGWITFESHSGQGTAFVVWLPFLGAAT